MLAYAEEMRTEIITLGYTSTAELIPVLKPLVPPPGSVSGIYTALIVKTTLSNLDDILSVIQNLDRPSRNLMITVRDGISDQSRQGTQQAGVSVQTGTSGSKITPSVNVIGTRSISAGTDTQTIRVLEGKSAFIRFGESIPVAQRSLILHGNRLTIKDNIDYLDISSGFYASPKLNGDRVTVTISPKRSSASAQGGGVFDVQTATTTESGRLAEWITLGDADSLSEEQVGAPLYSTHSYGTSAHTISFRVDLVN